MPNTITNFLVGLGFEYDERGAKQMESSIDGIGSKALQLGALVAGAFGINQLTSGFAQANDTLGKFSDTLGVSANDVNAFGNAISHEGGTLDGFMQQLQGIEELRAGLLQGDAEFIAVAGRAGIDTTDLIAATDATEAYISLADQFAQMTSQQRLNAARALGLDEASIRLLSKGRDQVSRIVDEQRRLRPVTEQMTKASARFNDETQVLGNNIGRQADRISTKLLPEINNVISDVNAWFTANDKIINQGMDEVLDPIADNFSEVATAAGLFAASGALGTFAGLARYVPLVGGGLAGIATSLGSIVAIGGAGAAGYAVGNVLREYIPEDINEEIGRTTARVFAAFGDEDAQAALDTERMVLESQGLEQPGIPIWDWDADQASEALGVELPEWLFQPIVPDTSNPLRDSNVVTVPQPESVSDVPPSDYVPQITIPARGDVPESDIAPLPVDITPRMGDVPQAPGQNINITPYMGDVPQAQNQDVSITPYMGELEQPLPMGVDVNPVLGEMDSIQADSVSPTIRSEQTRTEVTRTEQRATQQNNTQSRQPSKLDVSLNLDGRVLDRRIIDVTNQQNELAVQDFESNIAG